MNKHIITSQDNFAHPQVSETLPGHQSVEDDLESYKPPGDWQRVGARFQCPICGLTRNTKSQIQKHMEVHDEDEEDGSFTCDNCSYQTISRDQLIEHTEKKHIKITIKYLNVTIAN